ncbi:hypothetical protein FACS1894151_07310 [Spirochaetia bacterium]|nr:hypothetical protein FACS1894151_07310 [Spirochaetia bacterium]
MDKKEHLKGFVTADIICFITQDTGVPVDMAMQQFYNSRVFEKLQDTETGLYRESPAYVYDLYKTELKHGHLVQLEE